MKLASVIAIVVAVAVALGGCGSQNGGGLSASEQARLAPLTRQVRRAAESFDARGAQHALAQLQAAVSSDRNRGDISSANAIEILTDAAAVESRLSLVPTTTTTTVPAPPAKHGPGDKKHDHSGPGDKQGGDG